MRCPCCESFEVMSVGAKRPEHDSWDMICMSCGFTAFDHPSRSTAAFAFKRGQGHVPGGA